MEIQEFFTNYPRVAVAFSGGADSSYLLWEAVRCGVDVRAYYVSSVFQPAFELEDARRLAEEVGAPMEILSADVLADPVIASNPPDRCYHCKQRIFGEILRAAERDGYPVVLDGTNASDDAGDRPGMRALKELQVLSPLRLCGLTKAEIRKRSQEAGLFTWDKPAYACLATRVPSGQAITPEILQRTERAERFLAEKGFSDFRVRLRGNAALLQVPADQMARVQDCREDILAELGKMYDEVLLDLKARGE